MKQPALLLCAIFLAFATLVSAQSSSKQKNQAQSMGKKTVEGCLSATANGYAVGTQTGDLYMLSGNRNELRKHVGQLVRITGTAVPTPPNRKMGVLKEPPPTLKVSSIAQVAPTCDGP